MHWSEILVIANMIFSYVVIISCGLYFFIRLMRVRREPGGRIFFFVHPYWTLFFILVALAGVVGSLWMHNNPVYREIYIIPLILSGAFLLVIPMWSLGAMSRESILLRGAKYRMSEETQINFTDKQRRSARLTIGNKKSKVNMRVPRRAQKQIEAGPSDEDLFLI